MYDYAQDALTSDARYAGKRFNFGGFTVDAVNMRAHPLRGSRRIMCW
jgi:hypothetical protein